MLGPQTLAPETWPISLKDVRDADGRIRSHLPPTPLREYAPLNAAVGCGLRVMVKHENHNPTNSFKVRNGLAALTALTAEERQHGVIAGTRGNHGQGLAYAGQRLGIPVTVCVPRGNVPDKNESMIGFGAELIEVGKDYDEAVAAAQQVAAERGMCVVHSTNNKSVLAGAGTITLEIVEQTPELDAVVIAVGGGSQAVGALTVLRELRADVRVYGVQAEGASAVYQSWQAGSPVSTTKARTLADGIATRNSYSMTLPPLCAGLAGFVTVTDTEIASALRLLLVTTHNLVEGAGAAGLAGLLKMREELAGQRVAVILSGGNIDQATLSRILAMDH